MRGRVSASAPRGARAATGVGLALLVTCSLTVAGCQDLTTLGVGASLSTTDTTDTTDTTGTTGTAIEVASTETPVSEVAYPNYDPDYEAIPADIGGDERLVGYWVYVYDQWGSAEHLEFYADGTLVIWTDYRSPDAENPGESTDGFWRADGAELWFMTWYEDVVSYSITGDTLRVRSPWDPDEPVVAFERE